MILEFLFRDNREHQQMAARCMGIMCGTLFDGILEGMMPVSLDLGPDPTPARRSGVMLGLKEVVINGHKDKLAPFYEDIHACLMEGLCAKGPENAQVLTASPRPNPNLKPNHSRNHNHRSAWTPWASLVTRVRECARLMATR